MSAHRCSWEGIGCNEALSQIDVRGVGRDIFWPPGPEERNYTVESIVGPRQLSSYGCADEYAEEGLRGAPMVSDAWSGWMTAYCALTIVMANTLIKVFRLCAL